MAGFFQDCFNKLKALTTTLHKPTKTKVEPQPPPWAYRVKFRVGDIVKVRGRSGANFVVDYKKWFQAKDWGMFEDHSHVAVQKGGHIDAVPAQDITLLRRRRKLEQGKPQVHQ